MVRPEKYQASDLLTRAMDLFWTRGYERTSVRDLENRLDLRAPAIYRRFGDKEALFAQVVEHYVATVVVPRIESYLGTSDDPVVDLYRFFRTAHSERGCVLTNTATECGQGPPQVRARVLDGLERMRAALQVELERAHEQGALHRDPIAASHELLLAMQGLMVMSRLGIDGDTARSLTRTVFASMFPDHPHFGQGVHDRAR